MESIELPAHPAVTPIRQATVVPIEDSSQVSVARRAVLEAGRRLNLDAETLARAEIVAVELARNILHHGATLVTPSITPIRRIRRPGEILISSTLCGTALQVVAVDSGKGIPSVSRALEDGFTTGTTPGLGLGAVARLSRDFDIFSAIMPESSRGTVVSSVIGPISSNRWEHSTAVLSTPLPGEIVNGDSWATHEHNGSLYVLMVDGLGHGQFASEASTLAVDLFFRFTRNRPPSELISPADVLIQMHPFLRATRGAAIALFRIDPVASVITFCGVGNISALIADSSATTRSMVSHNGTIGHQMPRTQEFLYPYTPGSLLIAHSDGITTSWKLSTTSGLDRKSPAIVAGAVYRDGWRGRDDATVMAVRLG